MTLRNDRRPAATPVRPRSAAPSKDAGNTLIGVFIGVVLGLGIAAGIAFFLMRGGSPYQTANPERQTRDATPKGAKGEANAKPRFDFYKILPGGEDPKVAKAPERSADRNTIDRTMTPAEQRSPPPEPKSQDKTVERFWLQAGSFSNPAEAENLKARLALAGWEAAVQEADVPDKGVRYRVRLGPYDNTDELNRMKGELGRRGFDVAVIKF